MRILAFSDLHLDLDAADAILAAADDADLILGVGDFAQRREGLGPYMARLAPLEPRAIYVAGNNESVEELRAATGATVLHGETTERRGLIVAGIGGATPPLPPGVPWDSYDLTENQTGTLLDPIDACDILISHSPPHGVVDHHSLLGALGSQAIRTTAERLQPRLLLCGHIHDCWGEEGMIGQTRVVNLGPRPTWFNL
ncbi:MAG: serine/threonine protein phosphatase [Rhodobacterales bacterium]|nr:MAG: serine/threonine protein phosphatase [Rhodobacterales bacterium]